MLFPPHFSRSLSVCPSPRKPLTELGKKECIALIVPPSRWGLLSEPHGRTAARIPAWRLSTCLCPCLPCGEGFTLPLQISGCPRLLWHSLPCCAEFQQRRELPVAYCWATIGSKLLPNFEVALEPHRDLFIIWSLHTLPLPKLDSSEGCPFQRLPGTAASLRPGAGRGVLWRAGTPAF